MTIRLAAFVAMAMLVVAGCSDSDDSAADRTTARATTSSGPVVTTSTPPTTTGTADQQVCAALQAIEARGGQSNQQELLQISATGAEATTDEIVTDSAFLSAAAVAGDMRQAGEVVVGLLEVCRRHGYI